MTNPVQAFRRQSQGHKRKGAGSQAAYDGAYTAELFAKANITGSTTDGALVTAVAGAKIRVLSYSVSCVSTGGSSAVFNTKPSGAGTAISHLISLAASGFASEADNNGLFETAAGEGLTVTTGTNIVGVRVTYILVD